MSQNTTLISRTHFDYLFISSFMSVFHLRSFQSQLRLHSLEQYVCFLFFLKKLHTFVLESLKLNKLLNETEREKLILEPTLKKSTEYTDVYTSSYKVVFYKSFLYILNSFLTRIFHFSCGFLILHRKDFFKKMIKRKIILNLTTQKHLFEHILLTYFNII